MTSRNALAWSLAAPVLAVALVAPVLARQTHPAAPPTQPVLIQPPASQQRFRQAVQQSQVRDQLQKSQVEQQIRQQAIERTRRPASSSSVGANDAQVDKAQQAQDQLYQAQQRDRVQRYSDALLPQPVPQATTVNDKGH